MKSLIYLGLIFPIFSNAESKMCERLFGPNLKEAAVHAIANKSTTDSIVRVDLDLYTSDEIDHFNEENKSVPEFAGFIFRYKKVHNQIQSENSFRFNYVENFDERKKLFYDTLTEAHGDRMSYVSNDEKQKTAAEYPNLTKNGEMYKYIAEDGKIIGVVFFMDQDYLGEKVKLLAWIWKDKHISESESIEFNEQVERVISSFQTPLISSVEKQNNRSIKFHRKLGFKEKWLMYRF